MQNKMYEEITHKYYVTGGMTESGSLPLLSANQTLIKMEKQIFSDVNGDQLREGDVVVMVDVDDLDLCIGEKIKIGSLASVVELVDLESNYITFSKKSGGSNLGLFGHRVAKLSI